MKTYIDSFAGMECPRKIAVTCKPLFHQGRGLSKNKIVRFDFEKSAVCIGFVVILQSQNAAFAAFLL